MKNNKQNFRREYVRPTFPKRAVVTGGMPYGSKEFHFGHIGGLWVHADVFARFLRDRIGRENVVFVSGTDCYGSPILVSYNQKKANGEFEGSVEDFVMYYHNKHKEVLKKYDIEPNLFGASALGISKDIHKEMSNEIFNTLYQKGYIKKMAKEQFYDVEKETFLNGRQVIGRCPVPGCNSEKGYADECDLGHPYSPSELISPISILSGKTPELRDVNNWYFDLPKFNELLKDMVAYRRQNSNWRRYSLSTIEEFLNHPIIFIQKKQIEELSELDEFIEGYTLVESKTKSSYALMFDNLEDREKACSALDKTEIRYRKGKTLVPFRLSGNSEWGVKIDDIEDMTDLTFWVWPESLFAPVSFTKAYFESINKPKDEWEKYWKSPDCKIYQFIGEDNIFFYGVAQQAMWIAMNDNGSIEAKEGDWQLTNIVANNHLLFMNKKASSSGKLKPPMASELLDYYTKDQLRMHFLSLGLANKSTSFMPKMYMEDKTGFDVATKEGNLLTNVFNRLIRSCFYTSQKYYDSHIPSCEITEEVKEAAKKAVLDFERYMYRYEFHQLTNVLDTFIRYANKYWSKHMKNAEVEENDTLRAQVLVDSLYMVRIATTLLHPIVPEGCEMIKEYLGIDDKIWDWELIFDDMSSFLSEDAVLKFLEPRVDFFSKHPSQLKQ